MALVGSAGCDAPSENWGDATSEAQFRTKPIPTDEPVWIRTNVIQGRFTYLYRDGNEVSHRVLDDACDTKFQWHPHEEASGYTFRSGTDHWLSTSSSPDTVMARMSSGAAATEHFVVTVAEDGDTEASVRLSPSAQPQSYLWAEETASGPGKVRWGSAAPDPDLQILSVQLVTLPEVTPPSTAELGSHPDLSHDEKADRP